MKGSEKPSPEGSLEVMNLQVLHVALSGSDQQVQMLHFGDVTGPCRLKPGAGSLLFFAVTAALWHSTRTLQ
jgi:hypothetical protein